MDADGLVPRRRGGRARRVDADGEPQPEPEYDQMDIEHHVEDDVEVVGDDDDGKQQRRGKRVPVPEFEPLDDYSSGPHDTTLLTRYHVHVDRKTVEPTNVIL